MKILYVSQYFPPETAAPAARAAELARHWAQEGHEVTVLTGFPNHPTGIVPAEYRARLRRMVVREHIDEVNVIRTWLWPLPNRKTLERVLNYSSFFFSSASTGIFLNHPDVVIATSPQLLVGLSGWWLAWCKNSRFVFEVRDLWPESLSAVGISRPDSVLNRSLSAVANFLYRNSDRIVVVTPAFKRYLVEHRRTAPEKIEVVEHGVETDRFSPLCADPGLRMELGAEGKFVVSYIGTMGLAHGLETLVDAACLLRHSAPDVLFLLVGEGAERERISSLARFRGLTNVRFVGPQPRETIPGYIGACDACLVMLKRTPLFKTVLPTKLLEFMACARPVIMGVEGYAREIVQEADAGTFFEPGNPADLADAVMRLARSPAWRESLGRNGRHYVVQRFSRQQSAAKYLDVLQQLVGEGRREPIAA